MVSTNKAAIVAVLVAAILLAPASAASAPLEPRGKRVFFGVTDTGDPADFGSFTEAIGKHPALIQTFRAWGSDLVQTIERWQTARARPVLHITTADPRDGHELITPRAIARGYGDDYLVRLNRVFWKRRILAYVRPLGEPNRCRNAYAAYDCDGRVRDAAHRPRWYRLAFRRIYVIVHGGGRRSRIDRRLRRAGLPPLRARVRGLPRAPVAVVWSTLPAGSPTVPHNRPWHFYPGRRWVDWVGSDIYSDNQDWRSLTGLYNHFGGKPFAITEWAVNTGDDARFVRRLLAWTLRRPRAKMLVYYQDFGSSNPYRIQNWPAALEALRRRLRSPRFPPFAPFAPRRPPPPPGGVSPP